ncbi:hypothetical protein [Rhizobium sp. BK008]|uniref:hypothetical protein n=1 Tax=Rhizobium sp. BK008 TaxID=2587094 RepID=UPI001AEE8420
MEVTRALTKAGASVVVGARNPDGAAEALRGLFRVEVDKLDLIDPSSIDALPLVGSTRESRCTSL